LGYLKREVELLRSVNSEHIVKLLDYVVADKEHYLVFEYYNGGDLINYRKLKGGVLEFKLARDVLTQVVNGLDSLYDKKIIHRDLKLNNVFVSYKDEDKLVVKIGDFSFARLVKETKEAIDVSLSSDLQEMSIVGTPKYMAPELFNNEPYSFKADIWSLGLMAYELLCGKSCFTGRTRQELIVNIAQGIYKIPKTLSLSKECLSFLHNCIQIRSENRFRWKEVKEHPFITKESQELFDIKEFRELNPSVKGMIIEDEENYIFNCNRIYTFFPKNKLEDERETIEDSCISEESRNELGVNMEDTEESSGSINISSVAESRMYEMRVTKDNSEYVDIRHIPKNYKNEYKTKNYTKFNMIDKYFI
jgi:serine/threonine protein kinase